jgi:PilZ domain
MKCRPVAQSCEPRPTDSFEERRRYPRHSCSEPIRIFGGGPVPFLVDGLLLDISAGGFRVTHQCRFLERGQEVAFEYPGHTGRARAVWNRILPERVETGFMILA